MAVAALLVALSAAVVAGIAYYGGTGGNPGGNQVKDFVLVASINGFNDSALSPHSANGVQQSPWPVVQVVRGTMVNITVLNEDRQTHSFQIAHYYDNTIVTIAPGQRLVVSFIANETGTFSMKCVIPCSVHWAMQDGELIVT